MELMFIPQPHSVNVGGGRFRVPAKGSIGICCQPLYEAALQAREMFPGYSIGIDAPGLADTVTMNLNPELRGGEYRLKIDAKGVAVEAQAPAAVFWALGTLRQLIAQSPAGALPMLEIEDWPDFQDRGVYYDVCRGRVPKLEQIKRQVDLLAAYKINQYQLYMEHTFAFRGHPDIGKDASPLTAEDILQLDAYCRQRHVELVPSLASFGHLSTVLKWKQYHELAEDWGIGKYVSPEVAGLANWQMHRGWSLAPANPKTYEFLDSLYAEFLPLFSSSQFNVCCDETWDMGLGQSYELSQKIGKGRLYLGHILKLNELCGKYGKKMMFWGDIIRQHPELIPEIPKDVTVLDWGYSFNHPFEKIEDFRNAGLDFYACPGTSAWVSLFPRLPESRANIAGFVAAGKKFGAKGVLNTDWGDGGHYNFMEYSWYGYLFGAEQSWNCSADTASFTRRFCKLFLGSDDKALAKAVDALGEVAYTWFGRFYQSIWQHLFFAKPGDEVLTKVDDGAFLIEGGKIVNHPIRLDAQFGLNALKQIQAVRKVLAAAAAKGKTDPHAVLPYWVFAADTIAFAAKKLSVLGQGGKDTPAARKGLKKEMAALQKRFQKLWLARNRTSEICITLDRYKEAMAAL